MGLIVEIFVCVLTICVGFWWWRTANKNWKFYKDIPGPPTLPLLGNALDLKEGTAVILDVMMHYTRTYGSLVKVRVGPGVKFLLITDYKLLEFILGTTKVLGKSEDYHFISPWLGSGLLTTSEVDIWKVHRKILVPAFHFKILEQFIAVFESNGKKLVKKLQKEVDKDSVDIYPYITLCALDMICESIMGIRINAQDDDSSDYVQGVHDMCRIVVERSISLTENNDFLYLFSKNYRTQRKALQVLHEKSNTVINQRRKELEEEKQKPEKTPDDDVNSKTKKPFLDILLEAKVDGVPLTQETIRQEVDTFMFAGHDTTTSAISFILYCLSTNPEIQKKACEEQKSIFADDETRAATYSDLQSMKYLELVIKESLRLYPSVPFVGRRTQVDVVYKNSILPHDHTLFLFIYGIHRNPNYFEDPEKFDPSRFESMDGSRPYAYIPFSAGPRNCIGQKFAMLEIKSVISKIMRNFEILPAIPYHNLKLIAETVLKSSNGIKMRFKKRLNILSNN